MPNIPQNVPRENVVEAVRQFLSEGIYSIPVPAGDKFPVIKEWQKQRYTLDDIDRVWDDGQYVGILLGVGVPAPDGSAPVSVGDIDVDCKEALALTKLLLPPATERIFGHASKPRSHFLYRLPLNSFKGKKISDTSVNTEGKKDCLIELRGSGQQTIVPPSVHKAGEPITWDVKGDFGAASHEELVEYVSFIGAAALLVRHWPTSNRHEARWALMGALLRSDWPEEKALDFVRAVVTAAQPGEPEAVKKIDGDIDRYKGLRENGDNTVGLPHLMELCGDAAVKEAAKLLALRTHKTSKQGGYIVNGQGDPVALLANAVAMLRASPVWQGVLAYNEFSLFAVARKELSLPPWKKLKDTNWTDVDDLHMTEWLQQNGIHVSPRTAAEAVQTIADENRFHPVREYLNTLTWDKEPRLDEWLSTYLGAANTDFSKAVGSRWLISAVARIYKPGCRADYTLVLEGEQGIQKSTALRTLAVHDNWFTDDIGDLENKDALLALHGVWIVEFGELANIKRSQLQRVKSFLTSRYDYFRVPYGHRHAHVPRSNVFTGSVNDSKYLADETGNRRFWPIRCGKIDIAGLETDRDQLWAEAKHRYEENARWWLDTDELNKLATAEQEERYEVGVWDQVILEWLENPERRIEYDPASKIKIEVAGPFNSSHEFVTITDVLVHAVGKAVDKFTQADQNQVGRCLRHAKWKNIRMEINGKKIRGFERPERQAGDEPAPF